MAVQGSTVVGVFTERSMADDAIDALQNAGFDSGQIRYSAHGDRGDGGPVGEFIANLRGLFTGAPTPALPGTQAAPVSPSSLTFEQDQDRDPEDAPDRDPDAAPRPLKGFVKELTDWGVPENEAEYYANEYMSGRSVVAVRAAGREEEALNILRGNGGYDFTNKAATRG